ncbi:glycosyltransferase [Candidatus Microgenomates bacterium]|nr:glycosyltransferase [Candidatus Microgenomates bacterium]
MKIACNCLIKNEENFIWFAINSVLPYVDEILVWDMGSVDKTVEIVKSIKSEKLKFKQTSETDVSMVRQQMLDETHADWIFILDGDEIWHDEQIQEQTQEIRDNGEKYDVVVNSNTMLIGDIYHYMDPKLGRYKIHDIVGHYNIRFIKKLPGLHLKGSYPNESYVDENNVMSQNFSKDKILFSNNFYLHASFLPRSSKDNKKVKYERGLSFPLDYFYPEVFFKNKPNMIPLPWTATGINYKIRSLIELPFKKIKRSIYE